MKYIAIGYDKNNEYYISDGETSKQAYINFRKEFENPPKLS